MISENNKQKVQHQKIYKWFFSIVFKYKFRLIIIGIYSFITGWIYPLYPTLAANLVSRNFQMYDYFLLIGNFIISFSFLNIKEIILFPIYNYGTYSLKKMNVEVVQNGDIDECSPGRTVARSQRSPASRMLFKEIVQITKNCAAIISGLIIFTKLNWELGVGLSFLLFIYFSIVMYFQVYYSKIRAFSWNSTELEGDKTAFSISNSILVRQNFIENQSYAALSNEHQSWGKYYMQSNLLYLGFGLLSVLFLLCVLYFSKEIGRANGDDTVWFVKNIALTWQFSNCVKNLTNSVKVFTDVMVDLSAFFQEVQKNTNIRYVSENSESVAIKNVSIASKNGKIGPIDWEYNQKIVALTGKNGVGKTRLALALANLVDYEGAIYVNDCLYICGQFVINKQLSYGENALQLLENAYNSSAKMIILDEVLDCISSHEFENIFQKLRAQNKQFLIITHNNEVLKFVDAVFVMASLNSIRQI